MSGMYMGTRVCLHACKWRPERPVLGIICQSYSLECSPSINSEFIHRLVLLPSLLYDATSVFQGCSYMRAAMITPHHMWVLGILIMALMLVCK